MYERLIRVSAISAIVAAASALGGCGSSSPAAVGHETASSRVTTTTDPNLAAAVASYRSYLDDQTSQLIAATGTLRDAIAAGDLAGARAAYIAARPIYERIASPAERFPALALAIDSQPLHGVVDPAAGVHKIEFGLWSSNTTDGLGSTAEKLVADVTTLRDQIAAISIGAVQMTDAYEQLVKHPITATFQQEPYSQLDLLDHAAQADGSRVVFDALRPAIEARSRNAANEIVDAFAKVDAMLEPLHPGGVWAPYTSLTLANKRDLSDAFGVLSSVLSIVAPLLKQPPL